MSISGLPRLAEALLWDGLDRVARVGRAGPRTEMAYGPDGLRPTRTVSPIGGSAAPETARLFEDIEIGP